MPQMWRCGNDGPELDADEEIQKVVAEIQPQLEEKLGKKITKIEATRACKQVNKLCQIYKSMKNHISTVTLVSRSQIAIFQFAKIRMNDFLFLNLFEHCQIRIDQRLPNALLENISFF